MSASFETSFPSLESLPPDVRNLVDGFLSDRLTPEQLSELEVVLRRDAAVRQFLVQLARLDGDLHAEAHATRMTTVALARIGVAGSATGDESPDSTRSLAFWRRPLWRRRWVRRSAVAAGFAIALGVGWMAATVRPTRSDSTIATGTNPPVVTEVAWLVNAQDCTWAKGAAPVELRSGTVLDLAAGLAELRFRSGAVVLLQGPSRLELLSGNSARLDVGRLTGNVAGPIKGFELLSPQGKVIDLGTSFGVAVADSGATDLYVFEGKVQAIATGQAKVVNLVEQQSARLEAGSVLVSPPAGGADASPVVTAEDFVRRIVPPPVVEPHSLRLNFGKGYDGTLGDAQGLGTGLTHRLPGTGSELTALDSNLLVDAEAGQLQLTTTNSDINRQVNLSTGEYLGVRLADLGFTGTEDFEVQMFVPNIPALQSVGQFGLYAGGRSDKVIRGGLISRGGEGQYNLFMVNNDGGRDTDGHSIGLFSMGDDLRLRLSRLAGKYTLTVENLSTGSSSTLSIKHPGFLNPESDLYVGLFGANTRSQVRRTLLIREFAVTVWTKRQPAESVALLKAND